MHTGIGGYQSSMQVAKKKWNTTYTACSSQKEEVIIKVFDALWLNEQVERDLFLQDAAKFKRLDLKYGLPLLEYGLEDKQPYVVRTYLVSESLRGHLNHTQLLQSETLDTIAKIGHALAAVHAQGFLHGNLKPENILLNEAGEPILVDFCIPFIVKKMQELGYRGGMRTPAYMAPESFTGTITEQSDQYALGCLAYELLTGIMPFSARSVSTSQLKHSQQTLKPLTLFVPQIPVSVEVAVLKAMAKKPEERFTDIKAFLDALQGKETNFEKACVSAREDNKNVVDTDSVSTESPVNSQHLQIVESLSPGQTEACVQEVDSQEVSTEKVREVPLLVISTQLVGDRGWVTVAPRRRLVWTKKKRTYIMLAMILLACGLLILLSLFPYSSLSLYPHSGNARTQGYVTSLPQRKATFSVGTATPQTSSSSVVSATATKVIVTPTAGVTPTAQTNTTSVNPTATVATTPASQVTKPALFISFEDGGLDGWTPYGSTIQNSSNEAYDGSHSLQISYSNNDSNYHSAFLYASNINLSPYPGETVSLYVYVPSGTVGATGHIYVQDSTHHWHSPDYAGLIGGQWTELSYTIPNNIQTPVLGMGLQFYNAGPSSQSGSVYVDAVTWN